MDGRQAMQFEITSTPKPEDRAFIRQGVLDLLQRVFTFDPRPLAVFARHADGSIAGGLAGHTVASWLSVDLVWVEEALRGRGLGRELMAMAEAAATERGCVGATVTTSSFEAPGFYERLGYTVYGVLEEHPPGHRRLSFSKWLGGAPLAARDGFGHGAAMTSTLTDETRARLRGVSTATLTTALFKRGLRNCFIQDVRPVNPAAAPMVGEAYTLRYIPAREDLDHLGVFSDRTHPQRKGVEEIPAGHVMVIDSRKDARAASAGGILITRMMMRGAAGVVTDGGFRDTPDIAKLAFPIYAARPSAPTNLILHHAADLNVPIGCGDVPVYPGDVMVGDAEGVVAIPAHLAEEVAAEAVGMTAFEDWVEGQVRAGRSTFGLYPPDDATRAEFEAWRAGQKT